MAVFCDHLTLRSRRGAASLAPRLHLASPTGWNGDRRSAAVADSKRQTPSESRTRGKCVDRSNVGGIDVLVGRHAPRLVIHLVEAAYGGAKI